LMMYTLGTVPLIFTLIYVVKFRSWVLTEEEEKRFQEIIEKRKELMKNQGDLSHR
ncbi:MAG: hypothetical protein ACI8VT_004451, partial [Saprospiraceae bacterium]